MFIEAFLAKTAVKKTVGFFKAIPWQVYAGIALIVVTLFARSHWIDVGVERCEAKQEKALKKALAEAITQELNAPVIAQQAQEAIKPIIEERIKYVRKNIPVNNCPEYPDGVQTTIREAATSAN